MILPILRDFPDQFETERLLIRCPRPGDGPSIFEASDESRAELEPWMPWIAQTLRVEDSEEFARRSYARFILRENLGLLIFRKADSLYLGGTGFHNIDWNVPSFEIGYWLRTRFTGQGYMTEGVNGLTDFARQHFKARRIVIRCDTLNLRSRAVAERAGYVLEAHMVNELMNNKGQLRDTYVFAKTWPD